MTVAELLLTNALVLAASFFLLWLFILKVRDPSVVDSFWAIGMVIMALSSFLLTDGDPQRKLLLTALCALWGLRLGGYLFWRWRSHGADRRYVNMMAKAKAQRGWDFPKASGLLVCAVQAPLLLFVCLSVQLGQIDATPPLGALAVIGTIVALIGISFESVGDWQLTRFKANPANAGKLMSSGLWRYTRHPNYFGDAATWWGIFLIAAETSTGLWALPAPALLTWMLMKWSGVPTVEHRMGKTKPGYADYVRRTSGFVPWFPKA